MTRTFAPLLLSVLVLPASVALPSASEAGRIKATLTAAHPTVFLGPPSAIVHVPTESITFVAEGETSRIRYIGRKAVLDAPITVTIPGVLTHEFNLPGSSLVADGWLVQFVASEISFETESVYAVDGRLRDYKLASPVSLGPVNTGSSRRFGGSVVSFKLDDGRVLRVDLLTAQGANTRGTLDVTVEGDVAMITNLPRVPVSTKPIALRVDDFSRFTGGPLGIGVPYVEGTTIRLYTGRGPSQVPHAEPYTATWSLPLLAPGDYTIVYYVTEQLLGSLTPAVLRATATLRVHDPADVQPRPEASPVFEYFHAGFGHYFITADEDDQLAIETGRFSAWERLGPLPSARPDDGFAFYRSPAAGRVPLCRFYTEAFAQKSSHFYTSNAAECELVKRNPKWTFEASPAT